MHHFVPSSSLSWKEYIVPGQSKQLQREDQKETQVIVVI